MTRHSKVRGEGAICGEESEESRERRGVGVGRRTASSAVVTPDEEGKRVQFVGPDCILLSFFLLFFYLSQIPTRRTLSFHFACTTNSSVF
jgi:hypothetical protein